MPSHLSNFTSQFDQHKLDGFLVTNTANVRYLTEYNAEAAWLLVLPKKTYYLTDGRFIFEARKGLKGVPVVEDVHPFGAAIAKILLQHRVKVLGFDESHMSVATFKRVKKNLPRGARLTACSGLVEQIRQIKEAQEVRQMRQAIKLNLAMMDYAGKLLRPGMTERQVENKLAEFVQRHNAGFSFDSIIASGPNSAFPHGRVTDRKLRKGDPVLIDAGIDLNGYKSDLTRMFFLGKMTHFFKSIYDNVAEAQDRAIAKIGPGVLAYAVDLAARNYLEEKGLARYFKHSLGHGVGLEIHENPRIAAKSGIKLAAGMVFTVEPGVYLDGKFGVRIEDMVLVTAKGCEVLSRKKPEIN